jgi:hypothetical protein
MARDVFEIVEVSRQPTKSVLPPADSSSSDSTTAEVESLALPIFSVPREARLLIVSMK